MRIHNTLLFAIFGSCLAIYLFVSAPPPLPEATEPQQQKQIPVQVLFDILAKEQAIARTVYTSKIVGPGLAAGLRFSENWKTEEAGPLPALLLREVSLSLQRSETNVGLFLGSDFPIASVNRFSNNQQQYFDKIKQNGQPAYFFDASNSMYTAMYLDPASAAPCVSCHNNHPDSPKKDWLLDDPMGATTWFYPEKDVSVDDILWRVQILRESIAQAYSVYLEKVQKFENSTVIIGDKWPSEGMFLPNTEHFMAEITKQSSQETIHQLLQTQISVE